MRLSVVKNEKKSMLVKQKCLIILEQNQKILAIVICKHFSKSCVKCQTAAIARPNISANLLTSLCGPGPKYQLKLKHYIYLNRAVGRSKNLGTSIIPGLFSGKGLPSIPVKIWGVGGIAPTTTNFRRPCGDIHEFGSLAITWGTMRSTLSFYTKSDLTVSNSQKSMEISMSYLL